MISEIKETWLPLLVLLTDICEIFRKLFNVLGLSFIFKIMFIWLGEVNIQCSEILLSLLSCFIYTYII